MSACKSVRLFALILASLTYAATVQAAYNSNLAGVVTSIATYPNGLLLFSLGNQPTSNGSCNATNFELDVSNPRGTGRSVIPLRVIVSR